nr:unnamed protein product [Digitaria exilis]
MATPTLLPVVVLPSLGRQSASSLATRCVRATCAVSDWVDGPSPAVPTAPAGSPVCFAQETEAEKETGKSGFWPLVAFDFI